MKATKHRIEQFLFYDYTGIETHLERMALKGWQIQKITPFYWKYHRIEPQDLTYEVTYFSEASEFNPFPTKNQATFHEYCKEAGWRLVAEQAQMQIFCSERATPTRIETDESVKLNAIHRAMKKNFLPSNVLLLLLSLFQIIFQFRSIARDPVYSLSNVTILFTAATWILLGIYMTTNLMGYAVWYYRSRKAIRLGGTCIESSSGYKNVYTFMWLLLAIIGVLTVLASPSQRFSWVGILSLILMAVGIAVVLSIRNMLKRNKASRGVNLSITMISCVIFSFVLTGIMVWGVFRGINIGWFDNKPAETYTATLPDGSSHVWDIYRDPLPLKVEDLQSVDYDHYSYVNTKKESVLLAQSEVRQDSFPDGQQAPELRYDIVEVKVPALFDLCLNDYLEQYNYDWEEPEEFKINFRKTDDPAWQADEVYQLYAQNEPNDEYVVCWGNRIVYINFEGIPTAKQIAIAVEKLSVKVL